MAEAPKPVICTFVVISVPPPPAGAGAGAGCGGGAGGGHWHFLPQPPVTAERSASEIEASVGVVGMVIRKAAVDVPRPRPQLLHGCAAADVSRGMQHGGS